MNRYYCPWCGYMTDNGSYTYGLVFMEFSGEVSHLSMLCPKCMAKLIKLEAPTMENTTRIYPISKRVKTGPNPETIEAIEGSIRKWVSILCNGGVDKSSSNCPLCAQNTNSSIRTCTLCPVKKKTGKVFCHGSPYEKWVTHQNQDHILEICKQIYCSECAKLAYEEVVFLKELLKEEQEKEVPELSPMTYYGGDHLETDKGEKYLVSYTEGNTYLINEKNGCYRKSESTCFLSEKDLDHCFRSWKDPKEVWVVTPSEKKVRF